MFGNRHVAYLKWIYVLRTDIETTYLKITLISNVHLFSHRTWTPVLWGKLCICLILPLPPSLLCRVSLCILLSSLFPSANWSHDHSLPDCGAYEYMGYILPYVLFMTAVYSLWIYCTLQEWLMAAQLPPVIQRRTLLTSWYSQKLQNNLVRSEFLFFFFLFSFLLFSLTLSIVSSHYLARS